MGQPVSANEVRQAAADLAKMRSSLSGWLRFRALNDQVMAGTARIKKPLGYAQRAVINARDMATEQDLADKLHALLTVVLPGQDLPNADLRSNPQGAVQLAKIAIAGGQQIASPTATGGLFTGAHPWLWPVLIVGGLLLTITTAIKTAADVAKDREEKACIEAGACTDYGFWLKAGSIVALAWFAWTQFGGREAAHSLLKGRGSR